MNKIPVILDTDIGDDIDDSWALGLLLKCPELDLKLAVSSWGDTAYRAKVIAKFLEKCGRSDVPVAVGIPNGSIGGPLNAWVDDYELSSFPGIVHRNSVDAMIELIMNSKEEITIIAIGPVTNIAAALDKEPRIAGKCRLVGLLGSIYRGHHGAPPVPHTENNIKCDIAAAKKVLSAKWIETVIAPLDSSAHLVIEGDNYQALLSERQNSPVIGTILDNFDVWMEALNATYYKTHSTLLFDLEGIYLAFRRDNLKFERLPIRVDDEGYTKIDSENGTRMDCAIDWIDKESFLDFVTRRLRGEE